MGPSGNPGGPGDVATDVDGSEGAPTPGDAGTGTADPGVRRLAAVAGAAAAAVALGVGELVSALGPDGQSLVGGVGDWFIDAAGKDVAKPFIELLGTNDKPALVIGIVLTSLALGTVLGRASLRRPWVGPVGFAAFAVAGALAGFDSALSSDGWTLAAAASAALAGSATLWVLLRVATTGRPLPVATTATILDPADKVASRRAFFGWAGAAGALAATAAVASRSLRGPSAAETARAAVELPPPPDGGATLRAAQATEAPVAAEGLSPYVTPTDDFYKIDTALVTPNVDPARWTLTVDGLVDEPFELTYDELLALPMVEAPVTLSCVSNEVGGRLVGNAVWQGVPLTALLERAGLQDGAQQVVGRSVDRFTAGFPIEAALDGRTALVAVGMNGEPLPVDHGFPARLVVAGLYGYVSATKWLERIELTTWDGFDGYWIPLGWSKEGPIKTQSRIDVPRSGATVAAGTTPIAGVAWAPDTGIAAVEVQVDDGPWQEATLGEVLSEDTWRQWHLPWEATPGEHRIRVRATDGDGATQTEERSKPAPDGATGWHTRTVTVT